MKAGEWMLGGGGIEQKGKRTHGHGQQCGDCWGEGGIRGLNDNGKNTIKIKSKNKEKIFVKLFSGPRIFLFPDML